MKRAAAPGFALAIASPLCAAAPVMMTPEWAQEMCKAWNADPTLTGRAMFFDRLHFDGPMMEATGNMGPFGSFLLLVGKVPGDVAACPAK